MRRDGLPPRVDPEEQWPDRPSPLPLIEEDYLDDDDEDDDFDDDYDDDYLDDDYDDDCCDLNDDSEEDW